MSDWTFTSQAHGPATVRARVIQIAVSSPTGDALATGDGQAVAAIPAELNGFSVSAVRAVVPQRGRAAMAVRAPATGPSRTAGKRAAVAVMFLDTTDTTASAAAAVQP